MNGGLQLQEFREADAEGFSDPVEGNQAHPARLTTLKALDMLLADLGQLCQTFLRDLVALTEVLEAVGKPNTNTGHYTVIVPLPRILDHHP